VYLHVLWTASIALPEAGTVQQVGIGAELHAITTVPAWELCLAFTVIYEK
jgi:hypothetical protein